VGARPARRGAAAAGSSLIFAGGRADRFLDRRRDAPAFSAAAGLCLGKLGTLARRDPAIVLDLGDLQSVLVASGDGDDAVLGCDDVAAGERWIVVDVDAR